jgi:hypothetical protein
MFVNKCDIVYLNVKDVVATVAAHQMTKPTNMTKEEISNLNISKRERQCGFLAVV